MGEKCNVNQENRKKLTNKHSQGQKVHKISAKAQVQRKSKRAKRISNILNENENESQLDISIEAKTCILEQRRMTKIHSRKTSKES